MAGSDNVVRDTKLSFDQSSHCFDGLALTHKHRYFGSITAVSGGLVVRKVKVSTDGGRRVHFVWRDACINYMMYITCHVKQQPLTHI